MGLFTCRIKALLWSDPDHPTPRPPDNATHSATADDKQGRWTTVVAAAVLLP